MDMPRFVEALSPSETRRMADALPTDVLVETLRERLGEQSLLEDERLVIEHVSSEGLKAELLRRRELLGDVGGGLLDEIEAKLQDEDCGIEVIKRLIPLSQACVEATASLHSRALAARGEVFYAATTRPDGLSRRVVGELAPLSSARVQQVIESMRESRGSGAE